MSTGLVRMRRNAIVRLWSSALALSALTAACGGPMTSDDGSIVDDAHGDVIASDTVDVAIDAADAIDALDAADGGADASPDATVACSVNGTPGECIDVGDCVSPRVATPGHCPGAANIQCCTADPGTSAWCPAMMSTPNAGLTEEPGDGGCPAGMLRVDTFCIDRFEASLEEVLTDGTRVSWSPFYNPGTRRMRAVSLRGAVPQAYVSGVQARDACVEAGKRLCTDAEWLRVCRSSAGYTYPYGNTRMPGVCNDARSEHPAIQCFGTSDAWIWSQLGYAGIDQQADTVALTGAHAGCVTAEGAFDMMGNLHEWTADPAGTFRGGYYMDTVMNGPGCLYATTAHDTTHWDYSTGFRCCADAP